MNHGNFCQIVCCGEKNALGWETWVLGLHWLLRSPVTSVVDKGKWTYDKSHYLSSVCTCSMYTGSNLFNYSAK